MSLQTCGSLYRAFEEACPSLGFLQPSAIPHGDVRLADRAIGHMRGQAEKVYLGACQAFMIRPAKDWGVWATLAMEYVCGHYGLTMLSSTTHGELWGCASPRIAAHVGHILKTEMPNGAWWHRRRGQLCGVKRQRIDTLYHEREGYGERCEPEMRQG